jgi:competence protein ComEC
VLENAGGLGTLIGADSVLCRGYETLRAGGVVVVDGDVAGAGSSITARGWLLPLTHGSFDTARARLGAAGYLDVSELRIQRPRTPLFAAAAVIRTGLLAATASLDNRQAALLQGITIGDTEGFDDATLEGFRRAGLSHVLAVSGENVAIVLGAIAVAAHRLPLRVRVGVAAVGLTLFVVVVGPEPSVLRAAVMGGVGLGAMAFGRRAEPLHALGLALIILIAFRPGIVYSVGLQLSTAATCGIVLWSAKLGERFRAFLPRTVALCMGATVAAQVAVAPVLIGIFGQVSLVGPLSNLLALPAVPPATIMGLIAGVAGIFSPPVGTTIARCAAPFAAWILWVADVFGSLGWAAADVPQWSATVVAVPVVVAVALALRRRSRNAGP